MVNIHGSPGSWLHHRTWASKSSKPGGVASRINPSWAHRGPLRPPFFAGLERLQKEHIVSDVKKGGNTISKHLDDFLHACPSWCNFFWQCTSKSMERRVSTCGPVLMNFYAKAIWDATHRRYLRYRREVPGLVNFGNIPLFCPAIDRCLIIITTIVII